MIRVVSKGLAAVVLTITCLTFSVCAFAQATAGLSAVSGSVRDASGAAVPGAGVTLSNDSKGIKLTAQTTDAGVFTFPALPPSGGYVLDVQKSGFAKWQTESFVLAVGQTLDFKASLRVATAATQVDVTAEAPILEESKTGVTATVGQLQIDNLPINGRRVDSYVLMTPGVTNDGEFGLLSFRGVAMGNSFLTDGNDTTNSFYNENAGRTRIGSQISQDAVQEFQVLSNGFSAEFGRAMGGVVNTVTRSGSNDTHGTGYWFFRNRSLSAADRYANGLKPPEYRHTTGASLGGAIKQDKLFYFTNFDYTYRNFPGQNRIVNNSLTDSTGNFIPASTCTATTAQCASAIAFIQKQMNVIVPRTYNQEIGFAKLDWRATDYDSITVDLNAMRWKSPHGIQTQAVLTSGNLLGNNGNSTVSDRYGKAAWTRIVNASTVNELRFGWFKDRLSDPAASDLMPAETGPLYITVAGSTVGSAQAYPRTLPSENRYQLVDNFSMTRGAHSTKFGVDFSTTFDYLDQIFNRNGGYAYSNITNFARDFNGGAFNSGVRNYTSFSQAFGTAIHTLRTTDINLYFQDTWKIARQFTFNYGLRYEKAWLPQPTLVNDNYPQTGRVPQPSKNFAPRFSLSYSPDTKTVIRGGYGIFWARFHGNMLDTLFLANGKFQTSISINPSQAGAPIFPLVLPSAAGLPGGTIRLQYAADNYHNPYSQQGTLAVERQIGRSSSLSVSYIWSKGIGLFVQRDVNLGAPVGPYTYTIQDAANTNVGTFTTPVYVIGNRVDTRYSSILQIENGGKSWYNAMAVQYQKRMSRSFSGQLNYTWGHTIENGNQQGASWNISNTFNNSTYPGDWNYDKGSSALDQRHRLSINWIWQPTFVKSNSAVAKYLINGWQLSSVTTLASAKPVTNTMNAASTSANGVFTGVTLANSTINGSGGWNRVPFLPISGIDVDQTYNVDARLTHIFPIKERVKLNLSFEGFNVFNTIHNTAVQTASYTVNSGGILRPVLTNGVSLVGAGTASQGFPDGTNARRAQASLRVTF